MRKQLFLLVSALVLCSNVIFSQVYKQKNIPVEQRVTDLMSQMTLEDKIGQMTMADYGSLSRNLDDIVTYRIGNVLLGGDSDPSANSAQYWAWAADTMQGYAQKVHLQIPLLIGTDAVHGHSNLDNTVIFPHNIGLGCSRNPELTFEEGKITAIELAATGIRWTFAPCLAIPRDERWGRTYEGYAETPDIVRELGVSYVNGINSVTLPEGGSILSCPKHFLGDGGTTSGIDRGNTIADDHKLHDLYLYPYIDSAILNAGSIMISFNSINGVQNHGNKAIVTDLLKNKLGFNGFACSDWEAINLLPGDYYTQVKTAVNAGVDMFMEASTYRKFIETLKLCVSNGDVSTERIDDAVRRILTQKFRIGLFEHPRSYPELISMVGSLEHRDAARQGVRESAVLLLNKDNMLPIAKNVPWIHVSGSAAHNMMMQCGGWTVNWQGLLGNDIDGSTVLEAIREKAIDTKVTYSENGQGARGANVGVVVIGEMPYAEWFGDKRDLSLEQKDIDAVINVKNSGVPVVCIILSGRPLILEPILGYCDAIIAAWLPGTEALGLADILFGDYQPTGKLSVTWPRTMQQIPINKGDSVYDPLFPFGFGITSLAPQGRSTAPKLVSATVSKAGTAVELSFSRQMAGAIDAQDFIVGGGERTYTIKSVDVRDDSTYVTITMNDTLPSNLNFSLTYTGVSMRARDGGIALPMRNQPVINPYSSIKRINKIPGMVQAERYSEQKDIDVQECWDEKGGEDIVLEQDEWAAYELNNHASSSFTLIIRTQSLKGGVISVKIDGKGVGTAKVQASLPDGWKTVEIKKVQITAGKHRLLVESNKGKVSINWIAFDTFVKLMKK